MPGLYSKAPDDKYSTLTRLFEEKYPMNYAAERVAPWLLIIVTTRDIIGII